MALMKIASWNVNSLKVRLEQVLHWLIENQPDVLALQEIKMEEKHFPIEAFSALNYRAYWAGQKSYNGVALITKLAGENILTDLPHFEDPQRRIIAATIGNLRIYNVYVPNGQALDSEKFEYKLAWLKALHRQIASELERHSQLAILGDFNIAPDDCDVYDPIAWKDKLHCSPLERQALRELADLGMRDAFRLVNSVAQRFSWWDYRTNGFARNRGLRIDLILLNDFLAKHCHTCEIDEGPRRLPRPSDHAPVIATLEVE